MSEFSVAVLELGDPGSFAVSGRCYTGSLTVGDSFTRFVSKSGAVVRGRWSIAKITAYRKTIHEIQAGLTAKLVLRGDPRGIHLGGTLRT